MNIFYCSKGQQSDLLTVRATFLRIKQRSSELEGVPQWDFKIQVSCDKKRSILGSSLTILHPLTEVRRPKFCLNGQQAKFVDNSSILSPDVARMVTTQFVDRSTSKKWSFCLILPPKGIASQLMLLVKMN